MSNQVINIQEKLSKGIWLFAVLLILSPIFVLAEKECQVNIDASGGGDGSSKKPYKTIGEALAKNCKDIEVAKGTYDEKITLGKDVELEGQGTKTIITKSIKMKDGSEIESIYIKGGGIEVLKDANVTIKSSKITGAHIGIETTGGGKITIKNCKIIKNKKGLYLQYGKNVDIRNNEVVENKEEGIDIRANVDGVIKNNQINNNEESGIEVIAGRSQLLIADNSIKNNTASGIAVQFYTSTSNLGDLKILGNILSGNGNYGVDCKIPSGGKPRGGYWSQSVQFKYNKVGINKKGDFAKFCEFTKQDILEATKTEKEIEEMKKQEEADRQKEKELTAQKIAEEQRQQDEEKRRIAQREKDWELKRQVDEKLTKNFEGIADKSKDYAVELEKEKSIKVFFFGNDGDILQNFAKDLDGYKKALDEISELLSEIKTIDLKIELEKRTDEEQKKYEAGLKIYETYQNKFGLWPWFKKIF